MLKPPVPVISAPPIDCAAMVMGCAAVPFLLMVISVVAVYTPLARMITSPGAALLMAVCSSGREVTGIVVAEAIWKPDKSNKREKNRRTSFFAREYGPFAKG